MIPKVIHYCWFGGSPLSEEAIKCIESWNKYCPDYEIKEWNELNFDINMCAYTREAYTTKKWAFVSDYARFWIIYHFGGVYFDTDVEVLKPIKNIIAQGSFMAEEIPNPSDADNASVAPGLGIAAEPFMPIYKEILDDYQNRSFICDDRSYDLTTVVDITTHILEQHGFKRDVKGIQRVAGLIVYPPEFFCPFNMYNGMMKITDNTVSVHLYNGSWSSELVRYINKTKWYCCNKFGVRIGMKVYKIPVNIYKMRKFGVRAYLKAKWRKLIRHESEDFQ